MTTAEAIEICQRWFRHLDAQKERTFAMQQLAVLAKTNPQEARDRMRKLDRKPRVFDGGYLEPAVKHLVSLAQTTEDK